MKRLFSVLGARPVVARTGARSAACNRCAAPAVGRSDLGFESLQSSVYYVSHGDISVCPVLQCTCGTGDSVSHQLWPLRPVPLRKTLNCSLTAPQVA